MTRQAVARRYAHALFDVARKQGTLDPVGRDLHRLHELVDSHVELRRTLESPSIPAPRKQAIVAALIDRGVVATTELQRLLSLLGERDRLWSIADVARAFAARARAHARILEAEFVTAAPLGDARKAALASALGRATGGTVTVTERVDPAIVGGVIASVGNLVFDGSVQSQLERFRQKLLAQA